MGDAQPLETKETFEGQPHINITQPPSSLVLGSVLPYCHVHLALFVNALDLLVLYTIILLRHIVSSSEIVHHRMLFPLQRPKQSRYSSFISRTFVPFFCKANFSLSVTSFRLAIFVFTTVFSAAVNPLIFFRGGDARAFEPTDDIKEFLKLFRGSLVLSGV